MLKIENFSKSFGNNKALKNVSFEVDAGEFVVILGPSGSGKTTLLRTINSLVPPDSGTLYFKDESISGAKRVAEIRKYFGMIFQNYNLVENISVINNILTGALVETNRLLSLFYLFPRELKLRALKCLQRVELLDKAYDLTRELSGGQKQRVGIGRAIMQKPEVILADEPIANLDPIIAFNIMKLLKDICINDGISVICNLHQVDFALQFADRIVCLVEGEVVINKKNSELNAEMIYEAYNAKNEGILI
jgi:phosphonate transport system ATP-binding protein